MARFCYVVLCHADPEGVLRLARRIRRSGPGAAVLLRFVDPDFLSERQCAEVGADRLVSDIEVHWGGYTLVEATLEALAVARDLPDVDHVVVASGHDYPVRALTDWEREVRGLRVDAVLDPVGDQPDDHLFRWWVMSWPDHGQGNLDRFGRRVLLKLGAPLPVVFQVLGTPTDRRLWVGLRRLRPSPPLPPVKCALWTVLGTRAIDAAVARLSTDRRIEAFFRTVRIPDEWAIPSVVADDPDLRIAFGRTSARRFRTGARRPEWVGPDLLEELVAGTPAPFVRKVAPDADAVRLRADALAERTPEQVHAAVANPAERRPAWADRVRATVVRAQDDEDPGTDAAGREAVSR